MMNIPTFWHDQWTASLVNHLWQSTVFAAFAFVLTLALKRNQARVRYGVWMAASAKFLLPFSLLMDAGQWIHSQLATPITKPNVATVMEQVAQPFQTIQNLDSAGTTANVRHFEWLPAFLLAAWICGVLLFATRWVRAWMRIRAAMRDAVPTEIDADVPVLSSPTLLEPGIFGILHPVLLLPKGILERLRPEQLRAIVLHEMCHVRRKDNLTFTVHMTVQGLFWFHPLTWWIGVRLIEEREHACDEAVLDSGSEAEVYAEGILNVCKFYVESPLACASGVSGADLKDRIARIMSAPVMQRLNFARKMLLGVAGFAAILLPVLLGMVHSVLAEERAEDVAARLPKFEVASIRPHQSSQIMQMGMHMLPDGITVSGLPLERVIHFSFGIPDNRIFNEPRWVKTSRFDVATKVDLADVPKLKDLTMNERWAMMLPVLEDRFGLKFHRETREVEVYTLVIGKGGSKMKEAQSDTPDFDGKKGRFMIRMSMEEATLEGHGASIESLADGIAMQLGSTIIDKTGLTGKYDYKLKYAPEIRVSPVAPFTAHGGVQASAESHQVSDVPGLFTAIQEQLGLKLVEQKEPVDVIVIDHIEQPSPN